MDNYGYGEYIELDSEEESPEREEYLARFSVKMRRAISERGMKIKDVASEVGLSPGYMSRLAQGKRCPSLFTVKLIADAIGVDPADLVP